MLKLALLLFSLLPAAIATLTVVRAPDSTLAWKLAILAGEYGHWLVLLPLGLAAGAAGGTIGGWRLAILVLCGVASAGFLRPAFSAWQMGRQLGDGAFSFSRLYFHAKPATPSIRTEVFAVPAGQELKLDFYGPTAIADVRQKPRPCVMVIHGGGWDSGDRTQLAAWNARWVGQGYAVAAISYRLAPQAIWPAQDEDVRAAVSWLQANASRLEIDPARLVLLGRSAGGQLATAVGYGRRDPAIRGVIALYAPHDMLFTWSISREDDTLNSIKLMKQYFGGPPDTPAQVARYRSASGQLLVRRDSPPTLLIHGKPDTLTWYRHSERLAARLQELGVPHTYLQLPWATHGFDFNPDGPGGQLADFAIRRFLAEVTR
jgi:acetyl esterase/lipase